MDAKLTLSLDNTVINNAKGFAEKNNISLSRLTEFLYRKITESSFSNLEELPISTWVLQAAEGQAEYKTKSKSTKKLKRAYYEGQRKN